MHNSHFLYWLIGFTEGDGSWFVRSNQTIGFEISQHSVDASVLYQIKKYLGFGTVNHNSKSQLSRYCLTQNSYKQLILLYNNRLQSNYRFFQFHSWCKFISLTRDKDLDINTINKNPNPISLNNAWLSGFIDAEGCFRIAIDKDRPKFIFEISQKEYDLLKEIANLLNLPNNIRKDRNTWVLHTSDSNARLLLIKYLNKYPLKTKKNISFINWEKAQNIDKQDKQYLEKVLKCKKNITENVKNI
jgi:hypothetical protein